MTDLLLPPRPDQPAAPRPPTRPSHPAATQRLLMSRSVSVVVVLLFVVGPMVLAGAGGWPGGRSFIAELSSTLGIAALGVLGLIVLLPTRLPAFEGLGADVAVRLHRRLGSGFAALLVAHVIAAIAADPARLELFEFIGEPWRAQAAISGTVAMVLLAFTSFRRRKLGLSYAHWRVIHGSLAVVALLLTTLHVVGWHRYLTHGSGLIALLAVTVVPALAVARLRIQRHQRLRRMPYVIERVTPELGGAATLHLRADGHHGAPFRPGQFAWIKLAGRPLGVHEHPFSYSGSAQHPERPTFTIRAYDGFSAAAGRLAPGTPVLVDGPHGAFTPNHRSPGMVLIAAGIGITPMMSILRTAAERGDRRHYVLVYGNRDEHRITFRDELAHLTHQLNLDLVHVLSRPGPTWPGMRGRIDARTLAAALPRHLRGWQFFLCGSGPAVGGALTALTELGIPPERVHAERFIEV